MAITTADIHAIADKIAAEGQQPTLAAVRAALGGGSYSTISEAMKAWKAAQQAAAAPIREAAPGAVTERLETLAADLWGVALGMANDRLQKERKSLETARQDIELAQREAAELADQLAADLDVVRSQLQQQAEELKQAQEQAAQLVAANAALAEVKKRADDLAALLEQERSATKLAQEKAETAMIEAARLAGKLDALQPQPTTKKKAG